MRGILVYGSLKQGFWNHERFNLGEPLWRGPVEGIKLIDLGAYPGALVDESSSTICERYEVSDHLFRMLDNMEQGAGYEPVVVGGDTIWVYRFPDETIDRDVDRNEDGHYDWQGGPRIL